VANSHEHVVRGGAAYSLGLIGPSAVCSATTLIQTAVDDPSPGVRANAIASLARLVPNDACVCETILRALSEDADEGVRDEATMAVAVSLPKVDARCLVPVLQYDPAERVRRRAAWALGQRNQTNNSILSALRAASHLDPSKDVQDAATQALRAIVQGEHDPSAEFGGEQTRFLGGPKHGRRSTFKGRDF
jgi:HEAT repeat protein